MTHEQPHDPHELIDAYLDGEIAPAEMARLDAWLGAAEENAQAFARRAMLHSCLGERLRSFDAELASHAATVEASGEAQARKGALAKRPFVRRVAKFFTRPTPLSLLIASLFIASLLGAMVLWSLPIARPRLVAEVILARNVRWAPSALVDGRPPSNLSVGQTVELLQGSVALRFDSGALVLLEGPAEFTPQGRNELHLRRGRLAARVPQSAVGFLVSTPTVNVVDLGTEFSLDVSAEETEVQVLKGSVQVRQRSAANHPARKLTAGEAVAFGNSLTQGFYTQEKDMNRAIFAGMMALLAAPGTVEAVPIAHWQFNQNNFFADSSGNTNTLSANANVSAQTGGAAPSASYAYFNGTANLKTASTLSLSPYDQLTVEFFIKPENLAFVLFESGPNFNNNPVGGIHAAIQTNGTALVAGYKPGSGGGGYRLETVDLPTEGVALDDGKWHHIAVLYDRTAADAEEVRVFVDYEEMGSTSHSTTSSAPFLNDIFNIGARDGSSFIFKGWMDEFRISSGLLTPDQFLQPAAVPEPETSTQFLLGGLLLLGVAGLWRVKRRGGRTR